MSDRRFARDAGEHSDDKPKNKRRFGEKSKKKQPDIKDRIRDRRKNPPENDFLDDVLDDFEDGLGIDQEDDFESFEDDFEDWELENGEDR